MTTRRAFTLIELVVSLAVMGVLSLAITSSIILSTRALPTSGGLAETQAAAGRALQIIGSDIRLATAATIPNVRTLNLTVADRTADASPDTIAYTWSGTPGDPLTRTFNGETTTLISSVTDFKFTAMTRADVTAGDRSAEPSDRVRVSIATPATDVTAQFRFLNARLP